jgi:hypothetical protein
MALHDHHVPRPCFSHEHTDRVSDFSDLVDGYNGPVDDSIMPCAPTSSKRSLNALVRLFSLPSKKRRASPRLAYTPQLYNCQRCGTGPPVTSTAIQASPSQCPRPTQTAPAPHPRRSSRCHLLPLGPLQPAACCLQQKSRAEFKRNVAKSHYENAPSPIDHRDALRRAFFTTMPRVVTYEHAATSKTIYTLSTLSNLIVRSRKAIPELLRNPVIQTISTLSGSPYTGRRQSCPRPNPRETYYELLAHTPLRHLQRRTGGGIWHTLLAGKLSRFPDRSLVNASVNLFSHDFVVQRWHPRRPAHLDFSPSSFHKE